MKLEPKPRWALGASILAVAVLYGLTVQWLGDRPQSASTDAESRSSSRAHARSDAATPSSAAARVLAEETAPWQAPQTAALPPGTVPVSQVDPPRPDPSAALPPPPVEPSNPAEHRPSIHNPGGVDRDRAPRAVLGLESPR